jgi:Meiotically up-regulated gene 113/Bacterial SH3 domain
MQCVYLLQEISFDGYPTGFYKIGQTTKDPESRKRQYKAGNPRRVDTYHTIWGTNAQFVETQLHREFEKYRLSEGGGDEWFHFDDTHIEFVIELMNAYDQTLAYVAPSYSVSNSYSAPQNHYSYYSEDESGFPWIVAIGVIAALFFGSAIAGNQSSYNNKPSGITRSQINGVTAVVDVPQSVNSTDEAYFRSKPRFGDQFIIGRLKSGEQVTAYEISPDGRWRRIKLANGQTGWIAKNLLQQ